MSIPYRISAYGWIVALLICTLVGISAMAVIVY